ncbi:hypothetical protein P4S63_02270 [Pseudoalteromonas sp. B193]
MFSKKAINSYDFLSLPPTSQTIRNRVGVVRNHFLNAERLHAEDRLELNRNISEAPHEGIREQLEIELHIFEHFFERIHRVSTLLIVYSLLENLMAKVCKYKAEKHNIEDDIVGYGILSFKPYLENNFGLNFSAPEIEKHWARVSTLNKLRNSLAHSEGDLEQYAHFSKDQCIKLKKTINSTKGLSLYSNTIMISEGFVTQSIDAVENFLLAIE